MQFLTTLLQNNPQFLRYVIIGFSGVGLDFVSFVLLTKVFGMDPILANVISTSLGITNNFILNTLYNFKKRDSLVKRFLSFYGVGLIGLLLSTLTLKILTEGLQIDPVIAKVASLVLVLLTQYGLNKKITFSDRLDKKPSEHQEL